MPLFTVSTDADGKPRETRSLNSVLLEDGTKLRFTEIVRVRINGPGNYQRAVELLVQLKHLPESAKETIRQMAQPARLHSRPYGHNEYTGESLQVKEVTAQIAEPQDDDQFVVHPHITRLDKQGKTEFGFEAGERLLIALGARLLVLTVGTIATPKP